MSTPVLRVRGVSKTYPGVRALDKVDLECFPGEVHAILGENGSGKSTLMKIASGVVRPDGGSVEIGGSLLPSANPRVASALGLATVYQDDSLVLEMTVAQNLFMAARDGLVPFRRMDAWASEQLTSFGLNLDPRALVVDLSPAQRQFIEIIKALQTNPKILLLDEPTSTLDAGGVRKLVSIIHDLTARGTGIIYVSHRLPEILELATRITVLRDGVHRGTFDVTNDLSEHDLITLMVGREIDVEYGAKSATPSDVPVLSVDRLSGVEFHDISFTAHVGEIIGFAGAEGNGQREAMRALVGLEEAEGLIFCAGKMVSSASPGSALESGVLFLSADRKGEAIFPDLGVGKNMVLPLLNAFTCFGILSRARETEKASSMKRDFGVVAADLDGPVTGLSGGNQQKVVLARSFRSGAKAILIDEPTQGVDAGARFEIYKAIRDNISQGGTCVVNSSDAQELAGICDRVLVFSRGRIVKELVGEAVTEENIVSSFLTARDVREGGRGTAAKDALGAIQNGVAGSSTWWVPILFLIGLVGLVGAYAATNNDVFLKPINFRHLLLAFAPVGFVAMAQLQTLVIRGIDVSVGSLMSLVVVAMSFVIGAGISLPAILLGVVACLGLGLVTGIVNGGLVRFGRINPVIATIATLSVMQGLALVGRPTPGGVLNGQFTSFLRTCVGFLPVSVCVLIVVAIVGDLWLHRTKSGLFAKAVGFREESARRNGAPTTWIHIRAYALAAAMAAVAGLFLGAQVAVGHPTVGQNYALSSIAAAVLGGAALSGGRGSFSGALLGAFFFALMTNVISVLGLNSAFGVIASGAMTLMAVFLYSGASGFDRLFQKFTKKKRLAEV